MKNKIKYELPIYSSTLESKPIFQSKDMDIVFELVGEDEEGKVRCLAIRFKSVLCEKHTAERFTRKLYDSYDRIVELVDSDWLIELRDTNADDFAYWNPKHYVMFLERIGLVEFIAQGYEVTE